MKPHPFHDEYQLESFSVERLMNFLTALDHERGDRDSPQAGNAEGWAHRGDG